MKYISKNDDLLAQSIPGNYYILDSIINRIDIYNEDFQLFIDIYFSLPYHRFKAEKVLKLHFVNVKEYEFYWNEKYSFYTVERYKFMKCEKGYYLSIDPYDESDVVSEEDHGIILCNEVEGYLI